MQCANCRSDLKDGASFCGNCGAQVILPPAPPAPSLAPASPVAAPIEATSPTPQPWSPPQPAAQPAAVPVYPAAPATAPAPQYAAPPTYAIPKQPSSGLSIASLVLGILSLTSCLIWFLAIPFGIAALICGFIGRPKGGKGMALAGIITAILGIVLTITITAFAVKYLDENPEEAQQYNSVPTSKTIAMARSYSLSSASFR